MLRLYEACEGAHRAESEPRRLRVGPPAGHPGADPRRAADPPGLSHKSAEIPRAQTALEGPQKFADHRYIYMVLAKTHFKHDHLGGHLLGIQGLRWVLEKFANPKIALLQTPPGMAPSRVWAEPHGSPIPLRGRCALEPRIVLPRGHRGLTTSIAYAILKESNQGRVDIGPVELPAPLRPLLSGPPPDNPAARK